MNQVQQTLFRRSERISLVRQMIAGLIAGILLALLFPETAQSAGILGTLFVNALKAIAPVLVFVLVATSIANHKKNQTSKMRPILVLYLLGTFAASVVAVAASLLFPLSLVLVAQNSYITPPQRHCGSSA